MGTILLMFSTAFLAPLIMGIYDGEGWQSLLDSFGLALIMTVVVGLILKLATRSLYFKIRPGEAMAMVSMSWLLIAVLGAIPFLGKGVVSDPIDAFFESMSGFTSTGATVLSGLDDMDRSILLWRSLSQWLGGMGVIVLSVAVLSRFMGGPVKPMLMEAEVPGPKMVRMAPRMAQTARLLWGIYIMLTLMEFLLLLAVSNLAGRPMGMFDAMCHSLTTLPGGGFGTHDANIGYFDHAGLEMIITIFMIAGATSFVLHYNALHLDLRSYLKDPEFRFYLLLVALLSLIISGTLAVEGIYSLESSFRFGTFQVVSMMTTTGFTSADYGSWPTLAQFLIMIMMLLGGSLGSTSGALKMTRVMVILKSARILLQKSRHPRGVFHVRIGERVISDVEVANTATYVLLYVMIILIGTALLTADGQGIVDSMSATITCIGNVGPGLGTVGPTTTFASLQPMSKVVLPVIMWLGRLEILGCLLLFSPKSWQE
jgi:trk system potassium uptake protein TrkH